MSWEEACRILGVPETATAADIKEQYLYKAQLLHPDKNLDKPEKIRQKAGEELARINDAYKFLTDTKNNPSNPPKIEAAPRYIRFADVALNQKKTTVIEIKSAGGPFTNCWIDNSPAAWLTVTDVRTSTGEALPLSVTIEAQALPGVIRAEHCSLVIRLKNEKTGLSDEVSIGIEITPSISPARLRIKKRTIKFQDVPPGAARSCNLEIGNSGPGILHGYIEASAPWLSVSQREIILPNRSISRTCVLSVDTENLPPGFKENGQVSIYTNGGEVVLPVQLSTIRQFRRRVPPASSYPGVGATNPGRAYGGLYTATPLPAANIATRRFWFLRFILIFAATFGIGLAFILLFTGENPEGIDIGSVWGWGIITSVTSLLVARLEK
jgi:hypothetical protein